MGVNDLTAYDAYARRLAALADLEKEAQPSSDSELKQRFTTKREALMTELDVALMDKKPMCPLCDRELLRTAPLARLRQCSAHSLPTLELYGRWRTYAADTPPPGNSPSEPMSSWTAISPAESAPSFGFSSEVMSMWRERQQALDAQTALQRTQNWTVKTTISASPTPRQGSRRKSLSNSAPSGGE